MKPSARPAARPAVILLFAGLFVLSLACQRGPRLVSPTLVSSNPAALPASPTALPASLPVGGGNPLPSPQSPRLIGYYASWNIYARGYGVSDIRVMGEDGAVLLTHLIYAFAGVADGQCTASDPQADQTNLPALRALKDSYPHLRILVSVGGSGASEQFSAAAQSDLSRQTLARSCVQYMLDNGFDGIDIDWEYPTAEESLFFTDLLAKIRGELNRQAAAQNGEGYLLTAALGASPYQYGDIDPGLIAPHVDWLNLMAYNYHGKWSLFTGFNAPLYASPEDPAPSAVERDTFNVHTAVEAFLAAGVPPEKVVVGIPFYGYSWAGVPPDNDGLYQPFADLPESGSALDYQEIVESCLSEGSEFHRFWHAEAQVPWLYNPDTQTMISYDDPQSLAVKAQYVKQRGLGGVMVWQLGGDDPQNSLLHTLSTALFGSR